MANGGRIDFTVGFNADLSGLQKIQHSLDEIKKITPTMLREINEGMGKGEAQSEFMKMKKTISEVEQAFQKAFNPALGVTNIKKLNQSLNNIGIDKLYNSFSKFGVAGTKAFQDIAAQTLTTNIQLKQSNELLNNMSKTMMNTVKWSLSSSIMNNFSNSIQQAYGYVKHLDSSLNDIRIVTGKSADEMDRFAEKANKAAKRLGSSTTDYTEASLIYYQQGLSDEETAARAETTIKAANVTGQSGEAVSEQLTAVWNGYKVSAEEAELYIDKLAAVAATTASDLEELSTGMSKVASAAAIMGVDIDQLNAQLATIVSVTREAPESIGTALKTVYARMSDITAGLDGEVSLDEYTQQMEAMGIHVLDANSNLRDMGDVIEEIGGKWQTMTREQQTSLAQTIAGTRQYSRMMALFDNWGMYTKALETSADATGTLNEQNEIYLESTEAHLQQLSSAMEDIYDSLLTGENINSVVDVFTKLAEVTGTFIDAIGGGEGALLGLSTIITKVFGKQIAGELSRVQMNFVKTIQNTEQLQAELNMIKSFKLAGVADEVVNSMIEAKEKVQQYYNYMDSAEQQQANAIINEIKEAKTLELQWQNNIDKVNTYIQAIGKASHKEGSEVGKKYDKYNVTTTSKDTPGFDQNTVSKDLENANKKVDKLQSSFEVLRKHSKNVLKFEDAVEGTENIEKQDKANRHLNATLKLISKELNKNQGLYEATGYSVSDLSKQIEKINNLTGESKNRAIEKLLEDFSNMTKEVNKTQSEVRELKDSLEDVGNIGGAALEVANGKLQNFLEQKQLQQFNEGFVKIGSGITATLYAIQDLQNLGDIWDNENLSTGEKVVQTLISFSTIAGSATSAASDLSNGIKQITAGYGALAPKLMEYATTQLAEIEAKKANTAATIANAGAEAANNATGAQGMATSAAQTAANTVESVSVGVLAKQYLKLAAAKLLANRGKILAVVGIAAAVGAATVAIKKFVEANKSAEDSLREAREEAAKAKENYNSLKNSFEDLTNSIKNISDAENSLNSLIQGTKEWEESVYNLNQQILEVLATYPELAGAVEKINGHLSLNTESEAYKIWLENQEENVQNAQNYLLRTSMGVNEASNTVAKEEFGSSLENRYGGSFNLTEGQVDKILNLYDKDNSIFADFNSLKDALAKEGLDEYTVTYIDDLVNALMLNTNELNVLSSTVENNSLASEILATQMAENYLEDKEGYAESNDNERTIASRILGSQFEEINGAGKDKNDIQALAGGSDFNRGWNDLEDAQMILRSQGLSLDKYEIQEKSVEGGSFKYREKGSNKWINMSYKDHYDDVYEMLKMDEIGESFDLSSLNSKFDELKTNTDEVTASVIEKFLAMDKDLTSITQNELDTIQQAIENGTLSKEDLSTLLTPEQMEDLGYASVDILWNSINASIKERENIPIADLIGEFKKEDAGEIATQAGTFLEQADYIAPNSLEGNADWQVFETQLEQVQTLFPELQSDVETLMNPAKQGTEEWIQALEQVQGKMGAIAADADGIFTKEEAAAYNLTETTLTGQRNRGEISQEEYQQKFQGAMDYELEELGIDQEEFDAYTEAVEDLTEQYELSDEMVQRIAKDNLKLQKTVDTLASDWEEYGDVLKSGDKTNIKYAQGMGKIRESVEDMFGTDISDDFIQEHLEDIQKLAEGDLTVFDELQKAAAEDILVDIQGVTDAEQLSGEFAALNEMIMNTDLEDMEIGTSLDTTGLDIALQGMLDSSAMTVEQCNAILEGLGFEPEVNYMEVPVQSVTTQNGVSTAEVLMPDGSIKTVTLENNIQTAAGDMLQIPIINGSNTKFKGAPKSTMSAPKTSGGGGGGGGGSKPDRAKYIEDEPDRYHDVNIELKEISTAFERLGKAQEKLISRDLIDNLNEQLEVLQKQILTYKEKLKLMEEEKSELQGELGAQGVQFSEDGSISNYNDALINKLNQANAEIDRYNQMTAEQQEATKDADGKTLADRATEDYEAFKEALDRYDTLTSEEIPELQDSIQDAIDQQIEIQIQKFNMGIEVQLDMAEATKEFNEWKAKVIDGLKDDDLLGNTKLTMENMQIYFDPSQGEGLMTQTASHLQQVMDEIAVMQSGGTSDIYGDNMAAAMEDLTKYQEELMNQTTEWADYVQEVQDNYLDMIDEANDKIDEQRENYEFINNQLEHSLSIIEKMHGDGAYEEMAQIYELQRQSYEEQLAFQRQEVELWAQRMEEARLSGDTEALEKYTENWKDAQEELNSLVEAALDNLLTEYENAVNLAFDKLNEKVTGGMGLDYVSEEWELANQNAEMYLDTINEAFAIDQLRNKYQKSINKTSNLDTQKKLNDLMEKEIAALEKKDKLTQYDIERANMKYDIALKQIALEEAQQNKTTMRLKRDSQGNYTYQYTSDDDAVADAQQQLAEAQNSLYNFDKENYQNNLDQILSVYTEFQQKMAEAALINDEEQRQARMLMLQEQYGQLINGITAENEVIRYNLHESAFDELATNVYGKNVEEFYNMSQEEQNEIMSGLVPTWEGGVQQMADAFSDGFLPTCQETFDQIDIGYEELKAGMSAVAEQAGIDFQTYADGTQPAIDKMKELVQDNKDVVTEMGNQLSSMQALRDQALEMDDAYKPYLDAVEDLVGKSQNLRQAEADVTTELSKQKTVLDSLIVSFTNAIAKLKEYNNTPVADKTPSGGGGGTSGGYSGGSTTKDPAPTKYKVVGLKTGKTYMDGFTTTYAAESFIVSHHGRFEYAYYNSDKRKNEKIVESAKIVSYDTGGYTGEWAGGSKKENGKLAMLHQKELVLNEQDTANFLTAIQITRGMSGVLESVANKMASIGSTFSSNVANTSNGIQQQITINADFPDATSATEIEEALLSLVNRASQQAFNVNI